MKKAVIYIRSAQPEPDSFAMQEDSCRRHAEAHGWEIVDVVHATGSAYNKVPDGVPELIERIRRQEIDVILCHRVSVWSRDLPLGLAGMEEVEGAGGSLQFVQP